MFLITMAHLGEAQGVIDLFQLKRLSPQVFEGENLTCLITGEGPFEAATVTAHELGKKTYQKVINLGIAGSLDPKFEVSSLHQVRSVYLVIDGKPQFKSFKSFENGLDCITSLERILCPEKAKILTGVGSLIDREAWGVAMAAKNSHVPFEAYKLISDQAGTLGACELVKENAQNWSLALANKLKEVLGTSDSTANEIDLPGFYFTFSTKHQFQDMLKKISLREELDESAIIESLPLENLIEMKVLPKERTRLLLNIMEGKLDPLKEKLQTELLNWKLPFERKGIQLSTDHTWENPEVKISFIVKHNEDLHDHLKVLSDLNLNPYHDLRNGKVHVE